MGLLRPTHLAPIRNLDRSALFFLLDIGLFLLGLNAGLFVIVKLSQFVLHEKRTNAVWKMKVGREKGLNQNKKQTKKCFKNLKKK